MLKVVTLRCNACGKTYDFRVGADDKMTNWREISERISDRKEAEKIQATLRKAAEGMSKAAVSEFTRNGAEVLQNIAYDLVGEDTVKLLDEEQLGDSAAYFGEKAAESIKSSREKWAATCGRDGVLAFEGIYVCPKSRKPKQGLHLSVRYHDGKQEKTYVYPNKCDDCSSTLRLADDGNVGFMHEDCVTVAHCDCGNALVVDKVSFKLPVSERQ